LQVFFSVHAHLRQKKQDKVGFSKCRWSFSSINPHRLFLTQLFIPETSPQSRSSSSFSSSTQKLKPQRFFFSSFFCSVKNLDRINDEKQRRIKRKL
jgi:hypothetical protein